MSSEVSFKVVDIKKAVKHGYVVVNVQFNGSERTYCYVRKNYGGITIIDGCRITFNNDFVVTSIEREYETAGVKKFDTSKQDGKRKNPVTYPEYESEADWNDEDEGTTIELKSERTEDKSEPIPPKYDVDKPVRHERYEEIKMCLMNNIPVYLAGPAGSGKNHTVEQIAEELGWNFYFSNSVQQEYKLTGFIDAGGCFHETEFYKACTNEDDCIFFLDEMDASIPEVLVLLNAAIANGYFEFPNGRVDFDKVHFVAAGNTVGSGSDEMYTGRMVLDQATLDRFAIIEFDYSRRIEMHITKGNVDLIEFIHQLRDEASKKGIRATFSYRCMTMTTKLELGGMDLSMIMKISIVKGLDKDTINTLNPTGSTKYHKALREVKNAA